MKTRIHQTLAAMVIVAAQWSVLGAQIPEWYSTHKSLRYPSDLYIIGVGAGSGDKAVEAAKKAAQTDLVSQIRIQVQAQIRSVSESYQLNKNEQLYSEVRSNIRTAVSDEITGMEVAETVTDQASGTAYALVVLNRDKYCENLRSELDAGWKQAGGLRSGSTDFANQGKLNEALQNLVDARSVITPLLTRQTLYNVVSNTPYKAPADFGPVTISSDIRNILSSVKLARKSGDKQKGRVGEPFAEPFVVQVTIDRAGAPVPVAGSTVVFETSDKTKVGEAITDERGMAGFSMTVRTVKGNGVRARLSFKKLDREFEQEFVSSAVNFSWKAEPSGVTFELRVDTQMPKVDVKLRSTLTSLIGEIGYRIVPASNYVIRVSEDEVKVNTVDGMTGTMYSVSVNILATLTEKGADHPLGSVTFAGKALARTQTEANEKAVANAKIGQKELAELLEKAAQK